MREAHESELKCNSTTVFVIDIIFMTSLGLLI